jgi:hypothetical protein
MSCDKKIRDVKLAQAKLDEVTAALAEATKQEQDEEKKHADAEAGFIMFVVSSATLGLVSKCRIPTTAVAQRGLFRILLGSSGAPSGIEDVQSKDFWPDSNNNGYAFYHRVDQVNGGDTDPTHTTGFSKKNALWYQ